MCAHAIQYKLPLSTSRSFVLLVALGLHQTLSQSFHCPSCGTLPVQRGDIRLHTTMPSSVGRCPCRNLYLLARQGVQHARLVVLMRTAVNVLRRLCPLRHAVPHTHTASTPTTLQTRPRRRARQGSTSTRWAAKLLMCNCLPPAAHCCPSCCWLSSLIVSAGALRLHALCVPLPARVHRPAQGTRTRTAVGCRLGAAGMLSLNVRATPRLHCCI
jgi:hypothetical protein